MQSIKAMCCVENEDVVGEAPTGDIRLKYLSECVLYIRDLTVHKIKCWVQLVDFPSLHSLLYTDAIWRYWSGSTFIYQMVCCLMASICWPIVSIVMWSLPEGNFTGNARDTNHIACYRFENLQSSPCFVVDNGLIYGLHGVLYCSPFTPPPPNAAYMRQWIG